MLKRKMLAILEKRRCEKGHKCLVVKGQRQVGKTYLLCRSGEEYENFIELNFIERTELKDIFKDDLRAGSVISKTNMFFDEGIFEEKNGTVCYPLSPSAFIGDIVGRP